VAQRRSPARRGCLLNGEDRELTPRRQSGFAPELGATWTRTLQTGQLPMLQEPPEFALAVEDFCVAHNSG
jgi:hypothetical protein